jgi:hypothetical protein
MKDAHGMAIEGSEIERTVSNPLYISASASCTSFGIPKKNEINNTKSFSFSSLDDDNDESEARRLITELDFFLICVASEFGDGLELFCLFEDDFFFDLLSVSDDNDDFE